MPFLGKTPQQFVDPEVDIDGGSIDGTAIGATSASTATVTTFTSTGIDDNATSTAITIDSSQNVGIGKTPSASYSLDVSGNVYAGTYTVGNGNSYKFLQNDGTEDNALYYSPSDELFVGRDNGAIKFRTGANIRATIDSSGNVGIGLTSPQRTMHLNGGATRTDVQLTLDGFGEGASNGVQFGTLSTGAYIWNFENTELYFGTNNTRRVTIDSSGNLLVGVTSPVYSGRGLIQTQTSSSVALCYASTTSSTGQAGWAARGDNGDASAYAMYYNSAISDNATYCGFFNGPDNITHFVYTKNNVLRISTSGTHIGSTNGTVVGTQTSDERIKNIESGFEYGLDSVMALTPIAYSFNGEQERRLGFGAQTTQAIVPEAVYDTGECIDGYDGDEENPMVQTAKSSDTKLAMEYVQLIPVLTKAIQEQQAIIEDLQTRLSALEAN